MEALNWFRRSYPELVESMRKCDHNISDEVVSPYHAEGDIFTHTIMVYRNVLGMENRTVELELAALLHDIGKPSTRHKKANKAHYSFTDHELVSTHMAVDILKDYEKDFNTKINIPLILSGINFHQDIIKLGTIDESGSFSLEQEEMIYLNHKFGDLELYSFMLDLSYADAKGRICFDSDLIEKRFEFLYNYIPVMPFVGNKDERPKAIMISGAPGSGKSTVCEKLLKEGDFVYLSADSILMENYPDTPYGMVFTLKKRDKAIIELDRRLDKAISERKNILIDGTNIDMLARTRRLAKIPDKYYYKEGINVVASLNTLLKRNKKRKEELRDIPEDVIISQANSFEFIGNDVVHSNKVFY